MNNRSDAARELKINSLYKYGHEICRVPGLGVDIYPKRFAVDVTIEDWEAFSKYARNQGWPFDARSLIQLVTSWSIDLEELGAPYRDRYRPALIPHLIGYPEWKEELESIPLIVIADRSFSAEARVQGIVALHAGLLRRMDDFLNVVIAIMNLRKLPSFWNRKDQLFKTLLAVLRAASEGQMDRSFSLNEYEDMLNELSPSDESAVAFRSFKSVLWAQLVSFIIAHEYAHLMMNHHGDRLGVLRPNVWPLRLAQEIEADICAAAALASSWRKALAAVGLPEDHSKYAWPIAVGLYCIVLSGEKRTKSFEEGSDLFTRRDPCDYPDSIGRLVHILDLLCPQENWFKRDHALWPSLADLAEFHAYVAENPVA